MAFDRCRCKSRFEATLAFGACDIFGFNCMLGALGLDAPGWGMYIVAVADGPPAGVDAFAGGTFPLLSTISGLSLLLRAIAAAVAKASAILVAS